MKLINARHLLKKSKMLSVSFSLNFFIIIIIAGDVVKYPPLIKKKHNYKKMKNRNYMFKINGDIIKPSDFKNVFGIRYTSMFQGKNLEIKTLPFGTHIRSYKNITFVVIIY